MCLCFKSGRKRALKIEEKVREEKFVIKSQLCVEDYKYEVEKGGEKRKL